MLKWSGRLGRGDARVEAFLAFVGCASFGKNLCQGHPPMGLTISTGRLTE